MSIHKFANAMSKLASQHIGATVLPMEFGTILEDLVTGSDLRMKPDSMNVDLSYNHGEITVADHLILRTGDRVVVIGINGGQDHVILCRVSINPAQAVRDGDVR
jgi:hypothetical protein